MILRRVIYILAYNEDTNALELSISTLVRKLLGKWYINSLSEK